MSDSNSPSAYWTRQHGTKRIYIDPVTADLAAKQLTEDQGERHGGAVWEAYECRWGQRYEAGETAELHWHVVRPGRRHSCEA